MTEPRQFDVYEMTDGTKVVVIQSDLLEAMATRVVAPLLPRGNAGRSLKSLTPEVMIGAETLVFMPQLLATLTTIELGDRISNVGAHRDEITRALDALLSGI